MTPSGISHSYDQGIAVGCKSVIAAILYTNICLWIKHNLLSGHNIIDGKAWTYQSISYITEYFPEFSEKQIRDGLDILVAKNLLIKANHSKNKFDRTCWYGLPDESVLRLERFSKKLFDTPQRANADVLQGKCNKHVGTIYISSLSEDIEPPAKAETISISEEEKIFILSDPDGTPVKQGTFKMSLVKWDHLVQKYGSFQVEKSATALGRYMAKTGKKYKNHYIVLEDFITSDLEKVKTEKFKSAKRDFRYFPGNYTMERPPETETY